MSQNVFFSVIIPFLNHKEIILNSLNSLKKQSYQSFDVIIINNGVDDLMFLKDIYTFNIVIYNCNCNEYYAKAINKGYYLSKGNYLLFMNSDVNLDKEYFNNIVNVLSKESGMECLWGKIFNLQNKIESIGVREGITLRPIDEKSDILKVIGPPGAVFAVSKKFCKKLIEKYGDIMDEEISFFYSDLSFAKRIETLQCKNYFINNNCAYHIRHGSIFLKKSFIPFSFFKFEKNYQALLIENRSIFLKKWYSFKKHFLNLPFIFAYSLIIKFIYFCSRN